MAKFSKEPVTTIGIDLAKNSVHVFGVDAQGEAVFSRKLGRRALSAFIAQQPSCRIAMEACGSAHHWARTCQGLGHEVVLIAPQHVKPFVKSHKTDAADAEAICEAAQRPRMRCVPVKSVEQQDIQAIHRMRSQVIAQRTALVNQVRGLLAEYGIVMPQGRKAAMARLPEILEDAGNGLSERFRAELQGLLEELRHLDERVAHYDCQIKAVADTSESVQRLMTIPGIGPLVATALLATLGEDWSLFRQRPRAGSLARASAATAFHRRETAATGHQQARRCLPEAAVDPRRPRHDALGRTQGRRHQSLGARIETAPASERRQCGHGQQAGPDCLGGDDHREDLRSRARRPRQGGCRNGVTVGRPPSRTVNPPSRGTHRVPTPRVAESEIHCDGMKGTTALLKTWKGPKPASAETESLIEDGEVREFHQGTGIDHDHDPANDAGYMAATIPSADRRFSSCIAGRTYMAPFHLFTVTFSLLRSQGLTFGLPRLKARWGGCVTLRRTRREPWVRR